MPIKPILLQRRHAELGRIRLGHKAATSNGKTRPAKLGAFRFTSPSERYIRDLAELYGGEPRAWDNGGVNEFEVFTDAKSIPVIVIRGGLSQWMETWSGGGCIHRCDGEINVLTNQPCDLNERVQIGRDTVNPHEVARPTTRLSAMLPELEAIGAWRMESKGWNAAAEIPAVAELAQFVGDLVPAHLNLVERRSIKDGQTSRFVVPVLDLQIGTARLREIVAEKSGTTAAPELEAPAAGGRPALGSGQAPTAPVPDYGAHADAALDVDTVRDLWNQAKAAGHLTDDLKGRLTGRVQALQAAQEQQPGQPAPAAEPDADGVVDAVVVEDPPASDEQPTLDGGTAPEPAANADAVWEQIVKAAGAQGIGLADLQDKFAEHTGGVTADTASVGELQDYLRLLTEGANA